MQMETLLANIPLTRVTKQILAILNNVTLPPESVTFQLSSTYFTFPSKRLSCGDHNPCTADQCVVQGNSYTCQHILNTCDQSNPCRPQQCNTTTGSCDSSPIV